MAKVLIFLLLFCVNTQLVFSQGDDCATATQLNSVSNFCSGNAFYTNVGSSASGYSNATCVAATATEDVWFSFTAIGTDALISAAGSGAGGTMMTPRIAIYTGTCGGTINQLNCSNGTAGSGITQLYQGALIPGTVYFIRISTTQAQEGTFELCVNNYTPSANPGADCGGAAYLCNQNPVSVASLSGGGLDNDEPESNSCLESVGPDEGNSSWYYWTCGTSGTLTFDITPINPFDDIDFILYQLNGTNPCGPRTFIRCNASSCLNPNGNVGLNMTDVNINEDPNCDPGENSYCQYVNMVAGVSYALLINNFSAANGFTTNFGGTGTFLGPNPVITTNTTTICVGQSVTFNGSNSTNVGGGLSWNFLNGGSPTNAIGAGPHLVTYNSPGNYVAILTGTNASGCSDVEVVNIVVSAFPTVDAGLDQSICSGSSVTLSGSGATTYTWDNGVINNTAFTPASTMTYTVTGSVNGCTNSDQVVVTLNPLPIVNAGIDQTICVGDFVTLSGAGATSYSWNNGVQNGVAFSPAATTTYTVTGTSNGCTNTDQVTVTINTTIPVNAGPDQSICAGSSVTLNVTGAPTYSWNNGVIDGVPFVPITTTLYTATGTSATGCIGTDQVLVTVNPIPNVNAGIDLTICENATAILSGGGANTYSWNNGITNGVPFTPTIGTTSYIVVGTSSAGCTNNDTMNLIVIPISPVSFIADTVSGCIPLTVNFTNTTPNSSNCIWTMTDGASITGCGTVSNTFINPGCYSITLTATSPNGCVNSFTETNFVCAQGPPNGSFIPSSSILTDINSSVFFFNNTVGAVSYVWDFGDGLPNSTITSPFHDYANQDFGNYIVTLISVSSEGCIDTTTRVIQIQEEIIFYVPNTFTPDGDMFNQTFQPVFTSGFDPFDFTMLIFDRWGELIFETHNAEIGWIGTYGTTGKLVQDGIYTWEIEFKTSMNDEHKKVLGHVNVLK